MTREDIINLIVNEPKYLSLCKSIAKYNDLYNDLYQEFLLAILEKKGNKLIEAQEGGWLMVYCVGIINYIWNSRFVLKKNKNGKTSPLASLSSIFSEAPANLSYSPEGTDTINQIKEELNRMMFSSNKETRENAGALYKSVFVYKNIYQHAKQTGTYDLRIRRMCNSAVNEIKKRIDE